MEHEAEAFPNTADKAAKCLGEGYGGELGWGHTMIRVSRRCDIGEGSRCDMRGRKVRQERAEGIVQKVRCRRGR
jgi:hypothetical protein